MSLARCFALTLLVVAGCSGSESKPKAAAEEPWSHAYSGASDGWWIDWSSSLDGKPPFGPGTEFELETIAPHGNRQTEVLEVASISPGGMGSFSVVLRSSRTGNSYKAVMPPDLAYSGGSSGSLTTRNEKLVPVTVPAGKFSAGRLWMSERVGSIPYERDSWVVPDLPIPVQSWSRPPSAEALYNPPADGTVPEGTTLTRLVRITRR